MAVDTAALRKQVLALQFRGSVDAPALAHELVSAVESESGEGSLAMANALDLLASTYLGRGDGPRAIRFYTQALRVGESAGEPQCALAVRSSFLGFAHLLRGDVEPAVEEAKRAIRWAEGAPPAARAKVAGNAGAVFAGAKQLDRAAELYQEVDGALAALDEGEGDVALEACTDRATAALNLGRTEVDRGRPEAAARALEHSLGRFERLRALRLRPMDAQVELLRSTWARLIDGHSLDAERSADFERRAGCLAGQLS